MDAVAALAGAATDSFVPLRARLQHLEDENAALKRELAESRKGAIRFAGVYSRALEYREGDAVSFQGSLWICVAVCINQLPSETPSCWVLAVKNGSLR